MYEIHILELRNEEINVKKILAVIFILIFPGYITNQFNDQLPVGLIAQLERCTGIAEVRVRIPASLLFSGFLLATA